MAPHPAEEPTDCLPAPADRWAKAKRDSRRIAPGSTRQSASMTTSTSGGSAAMCAIPKSSANPLPRRSGSLRSMTRAPRLRAISAVLSRAVVGDHEQRIARGKLGADVSQRRGDHRLLVVSRHEDHQAMRVRRRHPALRAAEEARTGTPGRARRSEPRAPPQRRAEVLPRPRSWPHLRQTVGRSPGARCGAIHRRLSRGERAQQPTCEHREGRARDSRHARPSRSRSCGLAVERLAHRVGERLDRSGRHQPPASAGTTSSGMPATNVLITGRPSANASINTTGRPSAKLGRTSARAAMISCLTRSPSAHPVIRMRSPSRWCAIACLDLAAQLAVADQHQLEPDSFVAPAPPPLRSEGAAPFAR